MEAKKSTFTLGTPEEVRAWFNRAKARIAAREEEIRAMYKEEQRMKAEAERKHVYDLEIVQVMNKLEIVFINVFSPYKVWNKGEIHLFKTAKIKGEEPGTKEYVAIIIPRNHPQAEDVIAWFDHDTQMFDSMKP